MGKIIIVASGKGGTGKTTVTANIGAALAMRGNLVALVDMDMGCRNLDITLGLESSIVYDIFDVIEENCDLDEALIKDTRYENLYFIPAPQTRDTSSVEDEAVKGIWEKLSSRFDYCLVDAPAGIDGGFLYAAMGADSAILVTMPEVTALRDGDRAISVLEDMGVEDVKVVINRVRSDMIDKGIMMNMDDCVDMLGVPVLGIVPDDEELMVAALKGTLAVSAENSRAGQAFLNIAARLMGEEVPIMEFDEKESFFDKVKKLSPEVKQIYNIVKNEFMKYNGVTNKLTNSCDVLYKGRNQIAKINFTKSRVRLYLGLDPNNAEYAKIPHKDLSNKRAHARTPFYMLLKSPLSVKRAKKLIADLMVMHNCEENLNYKPIDYATKYKFFKKDQKK